jgi:holo-[acyl-carrier protein] synthase
MILGIGIDTIEVDRFASWHTYSQKKLLRIFSQEEIEYCLEKSNLSAERFAVRFAAREALYKALSYSYPDTKIPFLTLCARISVIKKNGLPHLTIHNDLGIDTSSLIIHLSLSHSRTVATACVVIEQRYIV